MKQLGITFRDMDNRMPPADPAGSGTIDLRQILTIFRRRRHILTLTTVAGLAIGLAYLLTTPPRYYAASKVLVDEQLSRLTDEISSAEAAIRDDAALMNELQVLQSQQLAASVVDQLDLVSDPAPLIERPSAIRRIFDTATALLGGLRPAPQMPADDAETTVAVEDQQRDALALGLAGDIIVSPVGRSYVIEIGYMSQNPAFAARVANAFAEAYLSDQLVANLDAKRRTAEWMQTRLDQLQADAQEAALAVETFKAENDLIADQDQTRQRLLAEQKVEKISADLDRARAVLAAARSATGGNKIDVASAEAQVAELTDALAAPSAEIDRITNAQIRLRELEQREKTLNALYQDVSARREAIGLQDSFPVSSVRILTKADIPKKAAAPKASRVLPVTMLLGLLIGLGAAIRGEFRERFFRIGDDVTDTTGLPFLGYLPVIAPFHAERAATKVPPGGASRPDNSGAWQPEQAAPWLFMALHAPHSGYVEVLRNIRIAADQSTPNDGAVMGVMSVLPDEGKTMTAVNYANALACSGARVLLIDADLRHPGLSDALRISSGAGIVQVLMDGAAMADAVRTVPATRLDVLPCIRSSPFAYAGEMLRLPKMTALMTEARSTYDYVVLDLPPIGAVVDAKILLPHMDSAVLVAEWGRTPRDLIRQQVLREPHIRDKVLGVALNRVRLDDLPSYSRTDGAENYIDVYSDYQTVR